MDVAARRRSRAHRFALRPIEVLANDLSGTPWRLGAQGPDAYDCWGLVCHVYASCLSVNLPFHGAMMRSAFAYANAFRTGIRELGSSLFTLIEDGDLRDFDIALYGVGWGFFHCGVAMKGLDVSLLHSREGQGVVAEPMNSLSLTTQFPNVRYFRLIGAA